MKNYLDQNHTYWQSPYSATNPESFIFRLNSRLFKKYNIYENAKDVNLLDFGCGQGANLIYFEKQLGFNVYGVDISKDSVPIAKSKLKNPENIKLINPKPSENDDFFGVKYDIIISSQALYYLSDTDLKARLKSFDNMLKDDGHVFFTMMSTKCWYNSWQLDAKIEDGLLKVKHRDDIYNKRVKKIVNLHYINLTRDREHLKQRFEIFEPIEIGDYELTYNENESEHHYLFFGKKK